MEKNNSFSLALLLYAALALLLSTIVVCYNYANFFVCYVHGLISICLIMISCIFVCVGCYYNIRSIKDKRIKELEEKNKKLEQSKKTIEIELENIKNGTVEKLKAERKEGLEANMAHEERMAIIKALGKKYSAEEEKNILEAATSLSEKNRIECHD